MNNIIVFYLAGLAINLMPCNLPMLLIKIYDIIKYSQTENSKQNVKISAIASALGIIFIFFIFSLFIILFQYMGKTFHLGFHFQNPYFLIFIILMLFLFALNLLGLFHINYSPKIMNYLQNKYNKSKAVNRSIFIENFVMAKFLVIFATPCSMPILGSILAMSLANDNYISLIINFLLIGLGMATPFLLILIKPSIFDFLKKKQYILYNMEKIVILILFLTIFWLMTILYSTIGYQSLILLILFMIMIVLQFKFIKNMKQNLAITIMMVIFATITPVSFYESEKATQLQDTIWQDKITLEQINKYVDEGKTVFVNIMAKWCMICNLNEFTVLSKYKALNYLDNDNVISIKIDITQDSKEAEEFYDDINAIYVPKYIVFNKDHREGCTFTGTLTSNRFIKELNKCGYVKN